MAERTHALHLLRLSGEEQRSLQDKRWFLIWTSLAPLIGLSAAYAVQLHQSVQDPYVIYGFPLVGSLLLCAVLWNLLGGYSLVVERLALVLSVLVALAHNVSFALKPNLPTPPLYVSSSSYWTLAAVAGFILLVLPITVAVRVIVLMFGAAVALPWLLNSSLFGPFAAALLRAQAMLLTLLLFLICLAWYRQRFVDRAMEALLLRELALTDLFAPTAVPPAPALVALAPLRRRPADVRPEASSAAPAADAG